MRGAIARFSTLLFAALPLLSPAVRAQELEPEEGAFGALDTHEHWVGRLLLKQDPYRSCQFVTLPTLGKESTVYITTPSSLFPGLRHLIVPPGTAADPGPWTVTTVEVKEELWKKLQQSTEEQRERARQVAQIDVIRSSARIDGVTVERLTELWDAMLLRVRPGPQMVLVMDGDAYHFATFREGVGYASGVTVSPDSGTRLDAFVAIGEALRKYPSRPETQRSAAQDELIALADALLARIRSEK